MPRAVTTRCTSTVMSTISVRRTVLTTIDCMAFDYGDLASGKQRDASPLTLRLLSGLCGKAFPRSCAPLGDRNDGVAAGLFGRGTLQKIVQTGGPQPRKERREA